MTTQKHFTAEEAKQIGEYLNDDAFLLILNSHHVFVSFAVLIPSPHIKWEVIVDTSVSE